MNQDSLGKALYALIRRDLLLAYRSRGEWLNPLVFFIIVASLFPLATSAEQQVLALLGPGVIWVAALLATLLSLDGLFRADYEDGSLEQWLLSPYPLPLIVLAKLCAHWLTTGLPLLIAAPVMAVLLRLPDTAIATLVATLALGTPVLSAIGSIGAALTVSLRRGGMLLALLILPLYAPALIFATMAIDAAIHGLQTTGHLLILGAMLVLSVMFAPLAAAAALRISLD